MAGYLPYKKAQAKLESKRASTSSSNPRFLLGEGFLKEEGTYPVILHRSYYNKGKGSLSLTFSSRTGELWKETLQVYKKDGRLLPMVYYLLTNCGYNGYNYVRWKREVDYDLFKGLEGFPLKITLLRSRNDPNYLVLYKIESDN